MLLTVYIYINFNFVTFPEIYLKLTLTTTTITTKKSNYVFSIIVLLVKICGTPSPVFHKGHS